MHKGRLLSKLLHETLDQIYFLFKTGMREFNKKLFFTLYRGIASRFGNTNKTHTVNSGHELFSKLRFNCASETTLCLLAGSHWTRKFLM